MKTVRLVLARFAVILFASLAASIAVIKLLYGSGKTYPDIGQKSGVAVSEKLIGLDFPPGNIAVAANGNVYFNYHPLARPGRFSENTVFEWSNGHVIPFPSPEMQKQFRGTFGMAIDKQNRIWLIEPAALDFEKTRIWAFDLGTRRKVHYYEFPKGEAKYSQDLRITPDGKHVLLANPGVFRFTNSTLLVYSLEDHSVHTVLDGGKMNAENWLMTTNQSKHYRVFFGLLNFAGGLDGIEISQDGKWVYLAPMSGSRLYRMPLAAVLDNNLTPKEAAKQLEDMGAKPLSDGITVDKNDNVVITDVEHGGLMSVTPATKKLTTLTRSADILWADGVATGPDGALYFTDSYIPAYLGQFAAAPEKEVITRHKPYFIYKVNAK